MIVLTRCYRFPAAHVLAQPTYSAEQNRQVFGKCANPSGHGHDYVLEVSVTGPPDPLTGQIIPPEQLDEIYEETIGAHWSHRMLNEVEPFGRIVPTAENIAVVARNELASALARRSSARVARVRVVETRNNCASTGDER